MPREVLFPCHFIHRFAVKRVHLAESKLHEIGADDLEQWVQAQAANLQEHIEEKEGHDAGPESEGCRTNHLHSEVAAFPCDEEALARVKQAAGDDTPEPADSVRLADVERVIDLVTVQQFLGLLVDEAANEADNCCVCERYAVAAGRDADDAADDRVAKVEHIVLLQKAGRLDDIVLVEDVVVLV